MRVFAAGFLLLLLALGMSAQTAPVFGLRAGVVVTVKARLATNDAALLPAFRKLTNDAQRALAVTPLSVTEKPVAGASGDKHDYFSIAPYFWPNPSTPTGRPYVRKDGQRNPESVDDRSDAPRLAKMADTVHTLALAYGFTGREEYAEQAARFLRVWFLDSATRMNPNFNQAQAIPGVNDGRGIGMIESRNFIEVCDAAQLLVGSTNWPKADHAAIQKWFSQFLDWTQSSKHGRDERAAKNNHGTWFDAQIAAMALFSGQTNLAREAVHRARERIGTQIEPDGRQPLELAREDSFAYSRFNLAAHFTVATLAEHVGIDLWNYRAPSGAGVRNALDYLLSYVEQPESEWPHQKSKVEKRELDLLLWPAAAVFKEARYRKALPSPSRDREALLNPLN